MNLGKTWVSHYQLKLKNDENKLNASENSYFTFIAVAFLPHNIELRGEAASVSPPNVHNPICLPDTDSNCISHKGASTRTTFPNEKNRFLTAFISFQLEKINSCY